MIISAGKSIGIYVDTPGVVEFDIGYTKLNQIILRFEELMQTCTTRKAEVRRR